MTTTDTSLHATAAADPLTAADAMAWFTCAAPAGTEVIGYTLSPRAATWVRVGTRGTLEHPGGTGDVLDQAYEMVLFDGQTELRWLRTPDGRGRAVALGEDPAALPAGTTIAADRPLRRGDVHTRLLAGTARPHPVAGWTTLAGERYSPAALPGSFADGDTVAIEIVEYLVEDDHGNLDVVDTRTIRLRVASPTPGQATNTTEKETSR